MITHRLVVSYTTFSPLLHIKRGGNFLLSYPTVANSFHFQKRSALCCPDFPLAACCCQRQSRDTVFLSFIFPAKLAISVQLLLYLCRFLFFCFYFPSCKPLLYVQRLASCMAKSAPAARSQPSPCMPFRSDADGRRSRNPQRKLSCSRLFLPPCRSLCSRQRVASGAASR